jgi:competence protein ComFC
VLSEIRNAIVEFLFPATCVGCGKWGNFICSNCLKQLHRISPPYCKRCGKPGTSDSVYCPVCWNSQTKIDGIRSVFYFDSVIRAAVHDLKYHHLKALSVQMAGFLHQYLLTDPLSFDALIPVPVHKNRIKLRGYNQSQLIAQHLGKLLNTPVDTNCLVRTRNTLPQARSASVEQRKKNVQGAFSCISPGNGHKNILLIDDVCTSGATLEACATALKHSGFHTVWGLTVAREI